MDSKTLNNLVSASLSASSHTILPLENLTPLCWPTIISLKARFPPQGLHIFSPLPDKLFLVPFACLNSYFPIFLTLKATFSKIPLLTTNSKSGSLYYFLL